MVMVSARRIKTCAAFWALVFAPKILSNREHPMTSAAENSRHISLALTPNHRSVARKLVVAVDAGVEFVAALESDSDDIAVRAVVVALSPFRDADAMNARPSFHRS